VDRRQAAATFERLRRRFPSADLAGGYDAFVAHESSKPTGTP